MSKMPVQSSKTVQLQLPQMSLMQQIMECRQQQQQQLQQQQQQRKRAICTRGYKLYIYTQKMSNLISPMGAVIIYGWGGFIYLYTDKELS